MRIREDDYPKMVKNTKSEIRFQFPLLEVLLAIMGILFYHYGSDPNLSYIFFAYMLIIVGCHIWGACTYKRKPEAYIVDEEGIVPRRGDGSLGRKRFWTEFRYVSVIVIECYSFQELRDGRRGDMHRRPVIACSRWPAVKNFHDGYISKPPEGALLLPYHEEEYREFLSFCPEHIEIIPPSYADIHQAIVRGNL